MGSVLNYINCPNCDSPDCSDDFYYKNNEEYVNCPDCGYHRSVYWRRDDQGNLMRKDETKECTFDNLISEEVLIDKPFGSYRIKGVFGASQIGTLETKETFEEFKSQLDTIINGETKVSEIVISQFIKGEIVKTKLYESNS
jgi:DNA-directed RNA polymerase subunit RPC12/RpoP